MMSSVNWGAIEAVGTVVAAVFTAVGLLAVSLQMRAAKKGVRAQFITDLERGFSDYYEVYSLLEYKKDPDSLAAGQARLADIEIRDIMRFMGFFENLKLILDDGVISMRTVDKLFSYRFFMTVNDPYIQENILYAPQYKHFLPAIFGLHQQWSRYKRSCGLPVPFAQFDLKDANPRLYREEVAAYRK